MDGNISIPNNQPSGWYDLEVWDQTLNNWVVLANAFEVLPPTIYDIDPNEGNQGQTLSVTISGYSMDYEGQWSGTLSDFRFSQWSGSNMFYGTPTGWSGHDLYGDVSIPSNQPGGYYDLEVWDYGSNQWIMQEDAFEVIQIGDMFTPNNGLSGETLQVFISGNSPSEFFHSWSNSSNYLYLGQSGYEQTIDIGPSTMATNNWQYNSSTGSYGFYATITIPGDYDYVGNYNLYVDEQQGWHMYNTLANNIFVVNASTLPYVDNIWPDDGEPGEYLWVTISGGNLDLGPNQWSVTSNFRFSQFSGTNAFYGTLTDWYYCNHIIFIRFINLNTHI